GFGHGAAHGSGAVSATAAQRRLGGPADVAAGGGGGPGRVAGYALQFLPGSLSLIQCTNLCNATRQVSVSLDNERNCSRWQQHQQQIV
ncbi:hypothetical protein ACJX0J_022575, partial [Zea mays]